MGRSLWVDVYLKKLILRGKESKKLLMLYKDIKFFKILIYLPLIYFFYIISPSMAEKIEANGTYYYGSDTSENEACERALEKAEKNALTYILGENLTSEGIMHCSETGDEEACKHYSSISSIVSGVIKNMEVLNRVTTFDETIKSNYCKITIFADIISSNGARDPSFDMKVNLNENFFRDKENLIINIIPNEEMYINIFNWSPHKKEKVQKIFPNDYDLNNLIKSDIIIPTKSAKREYSYRLDYPKLKKHPIEEFIMVIATKENINFMKKYTLRDLKERINEINLANRREITKSYILTK